MSDPIEISSESESFNSRPFEELHADHVMQCWGVQGNYKPIPVVSADGCWLKTADGRRIFDLRSAHECINLGFRHPKIIEAMKAQMEKVIYVTDDFATESTSLLAEKLAKLVPGAPNKKVWFGQSGAGAVEAALKGARFYQYNRFVRRGAGNLEPAMQYPYPYKIISRYRSWHGSTTGAASVSGDPRRWFIEPFVMPGVKHAPDAFCYRCALGREPEDCGVACADYLEYMIEMEGGDKKIAAVIVEPVVGSNGIIPPPPEYFPKLRKICDRHGLLLIVDETMTGFGRTGKMFAIDHYGIEPDILVMGKALGVYCPVAATIFSGKVAEAFDENVFGHGQSFSGHALGSAAALAGLEILTAPGFLEEVTRKGQYLGEQLQKLSDHHPSIGDVRGLGLFWTLELVKNRKTKEPFARPADKYAETVIRKISRFLLDEKNLYIPADKFGIWIVPPLIVNEDELD
ncbi:MAG TPA: aspartate aminotransferase family protein, partial [Verrucomicrobia bacterium]|nr:aspartate aminotransferase family protein [Verrucomicrobiota bacterium]